jgi:predicted HTH transcriptional regulator
MTVVSERNFIRLARLFGASPRSWTAKQIRAAVERREVEDFDLEFKGPLYTPNENEELGKDIAALANYIGGVIVLGVEEDAEGRAVSSPGVELNGKEIDRIHQALAGNLAPVPAVEIQLVPDESGSRGFLLLLVPQSPERPHALRLKNGGLRYPIRNGTTVRYLAETEVADAYRNRFERGTATQERLRDVELGTVISFPRNGAHLSVATARRSRSNRDH